MNKKKNLQIDIYRKRFLYFNLGLVFSVSLILMALEWKSYPSVEPIDLTKETSTFEKIEQEISNQFVPPAPPEPQLEPEFEVILDVE